ncbi:glycosyltransferase [Slackia piriformis]|uniref:glycosyltransferase n=1 Tax=Slackia piriformis TaxID=626934 RepID=UPI0039F512B9
MRILNVSAQKPDSTGSGVYLAETVRCQVAAGHDVAVVAGVAADDAPELSEGVLFRPVRFDTEALPFHVAGMSDQMPYPATRYCDMTPSMTAAFTASFARVFEELDEAFRPDAVLCHHLYLATAVAVETFAHRRVFAVCHSTDLRQMGKHGLERDRIVAAMRRLTGVFALHEAQKEEIVRVYGVDSARVHVVGTGFNASIFNTGEPETCDDGASGRSASASARATDAPMGASTCADVCANVPVELVYAGKIWKKKGVPSLLEAADLVETARREGARRSESPSLRLRLRLAGGHNDSEEYAGIVARAARCLSDVAFLGRLSQTDLAQAYRRADIFVLPSFFEGLPLVVIEALACGCKVVTTDLPGIRSWLEANAPGAPIVYVAPPLMRAVDEPFEDELPAFEHRLADAIEACMRLEAGPFDVSHLSWEGLTARIVEAL